MQNKSIVFLSSQLLSNRNLERFGFNYLLKNGWSIYYFECSYIFRKNYYESVKNEENLNTNFFYRVKTYKELLSRLEKIKPDFVVNILGDTTKEKSLLIKQAKKSKLINLNLGPYPEFSHSFLNKIIKAYNETNIILVTKRIYAFFVSKYFRKIKYDFQIISGLRCINSNNESSIVKAHSFDYDHYLKNKNKIKIIDKNKNKKNILFLDSGSAFKKGDDPVFRGADLNLNYENYFKFTNVILKYYQENYSSEIIICTHPKADLKRLKSKFNFEVVQNKTMEMIYCSDFVISYSSTAIQYAIIFKKPIMFYNYFGNLSKAHKKFYFLETQAFAKSLNAKHCVLDFDYKKPPKLNFNINEKLYDEYFRNYIKSYNSPDQELWKIIENALIES